MSIGNSRTITTQMGARNYARTDREVNDFYATPPDAVRLLLDRESFAPNVWECACGQGHIAKVLEEYGYKVKATDLIDRGYGEGGKDFLVCDEHFNGDIITNPPYTLALEFVKHSLELIPEGNKVAMLLKIQFLEGKARKLFFDYAPPNMCMCSAKGSDAV